MNSIISNQRITMISSLLKLIGTLTTPAKWLYNLILDQPQIELRVASAEGWSWDSIPIHNEGTNSGLLLFSLSTRCSGHVEISRIDVQYRASLQILDPGNRGFFAGEGANDNELPFRQKWTGEIEVRNDLQQAVVLFVKFPNATEDHQIRFVVYAKRLQPSLGGFLGHGRVHVTTFERRIRLIAWPLQGLVVPPKCALTSPQPFLIESGIRASTEQGKSGSLIVHERLADGTVSSQEVKIPKIAPRPRL